MLICKFEKDDYLGVRSFVVFLMIFREGTNPVKC